jgi:predicted DNA-binding protein
MLRRKVHLTESQRQQLKQLSEESGESVAALIRQAIDYFFQQSDIVSIVEQERVQDADARKST